MSALLSVEALRSGYGRVEVLRGVDLQVRAGETVALLGSNGAGKSTLNNTVSALVPAWAGRVVFDGADDYHTRINDPALGIDAQTMLVIRGAGPIGWPGSAEVVNMQPPDALIKQGITALPTLGDGRQSGTSDSPSILNASPESAAGGNLAWLQTGDRIRVDLQQGRCDVLISAEEWALRKQQGAPAIPPSQTPWQEIYRATVGQLQTGACMELALAYRGVGHDLPRHNH